MPGVMSSQEQFARRMMLEKMRQSAQNYRKDLVQQLDSGISEFVQQLVSDMEQEMKLNKTFSNSQSPTKNPSDEHGDKVFVCRESLLTELFQVNHIRTLYNIFVAVLMVLFFNTVLYDLLETGNINLDFGMMFYAFGKFDVVLITWLFLNLSLMLIFFPMFHHWAHNRFLVKNKGAYDRVYFFLYIAFGVAFFFLPLKILIQEALPPASAMTLLSEKVRMVMKLHAFVRENVPRARRYKPHNDAKDEEESPCPDFGKFLYFLFAPVLVYRDEYPRTSRIRWKYVVSNFVQVFACIFYTYYIFQRHCIPVFQRFGQEPITMKNLIVGVFGSMVPAMWLNFIAFFAVLHSWQNAFAEMLRFGDRMFYKDWWNSTSFSNYYRTWNVIVHDWLYTYVYKDLCQITGSTKLGSMFIVFTLSALVHEYILAFTLGFFYPVLLVCFGGVGVFFLFLTNKRKSRGWNVFMWTMMFTGTGILMCLYCSEWFARLNCPPSVDSSLDYLIPRSWTCEVWRKS